MDQEIKMESSDSTSPPCVDDKPVVHVDPDLEANLQALFDSALKPDREISKTLPLRMRQLPKSFFNPPSTGSKSPLSVSHSRDNSGDSAISAAPSGLACRPLHHMHSRARSLPTSLQKTHAFRPQPQQQHHGYRRRRVTINEPGSVVFPWEEAKTPDGQVYYLNHITKTTQWEDPRKSSAAQQTVASKHRRISEQSPSPGHDSNNGSGANATCSSAPPSNSPHVNHSPLCLAANNNNNNNKTGAILGRSPDGYEQAYTVDGKAYFINHLARSTSWTDPRTPGRLHTPSSSPGVTVHHSGIASWIINSASGRPVQQQQQHNNGLHSRWHTERDRQRDTIRQQEMMMVQRFGQTTNPFVLCYAGGNAAAVDHSRQGSADSGLDLGSNNYSLPHTPEDFLSATSADDNMDCTPQPPPPPPLSDNPGREQQMPTAETDVTDDLFPSLELGEDITDDILDEVQMSLINNKPEIVFDLPLGADEPRAK